MASCGHDAPPGSAFCPICGSAQSVVRCRCGAACGPADQYCHACGQVMAQDAQGQQSAGSALPRLSWLLGLLPRGHVGPVSASAKVEQSDIEDMLKAFKRQARKNKPEAGDATD